MNWKSTWALVAAAGVLFAFIVWVEQPLRREKERQASRIILPGLDATRITNIEIQPWGQSVIQAVRQGPGNGTWNLVRPVTYPAQDVFVQTLLNLLVKLEWVDRITERDLATRPDAQKEFGFEAPRFSILVQGSGPDRRLEVGNLGAFNDRVALQVVGNNSIYEIDSDILKWIPGNKDQWRDRFLLSVTNMSFETLRVRSAGNEFELRRDATNHLWFMTRPLAARADTPKINELLGLLQKVPVLQFTTDDPQADMTSFGLHSSDTTPELTLSFLDKTNTVAALQVGHSLTNATNFVFARRNDPSNVVAVSREPFRLWQVSYTNFLDQHFVSQSPTLIDSITVHGGDNFVVKKQTNGQWVVTADAPFPADGMLMDNWLTDLTNVPTEIVKTVVTDFTPYGLNHPTLQYAIHFAGQGEAQIEFGTNSTGNVFERRVGEDPVNAINPADFARMPRVSWEMRDRQVWNFQPSNVLSVTIHQGGGTLEYLRDPDGNWTYAPGYNSQVPINSPSLEECVFRLGQLRAVYWDAIGNQPTDQFGFAKASHEVDLELKRGDTNETLRIQFGDRSPFLHPYAAVQKDGKRMVFEFPADIYGNLVEPNLTVLSARLHH